MELFTPRLVVGEAPRRFVAAAAPAESAAQRGVYQPAKSPAADVASEPPRTPHPPIEFPSQIRSQPPVALGLKEVISPRGLCSPTDALMAELASALVVAARDAKVQPRTPEPAFDFGKRWRRHFLSVASRARSGIAATSSQARILRARVETRMLSSSQAVGRRWTALRSRNWSVRINLAWPDFARSWLQWLQAATRHTPRESAPVRHQGVPQPAPSVRALAVSQPAWRRLQNSAAHPQRRRNAENTRHLTTSVLRWLQQPTRTLRSRPAAHSSSTRIA